ncbi:hypothetical protein [Streptomyces azureus]|uniref:Uncharacterized protein n=1 Tax=Streptomyces azureus TaxID=146537 RepID=A0A0K8PJM0_STRAJ|nr:hypothetical protein [Streptomyces azureus]GAP48092.1 uncharacterized protein SAZU_2829 [Streptomyces azureus]
MSAATFSPASAPGRPPGAATVAGSHHRHLLGEAVRAVRVFAGAAFDVIILGQYGEEVGVVRRK